jgi:hypothetical protein
MAWVAVTTSNVLEFMGSVVRRKKGVVEEEKTFYKEI